MLPSEDDETGAWLCEIDDDTETTVIPKAVDAEAAEPNLLLS